MRIVSCGACGEEMQARHLRGHHRFNCRKRLVKCAPIDRRRPKLAAVNGVCRCFVPMPRVPVAAVVTSRVYPSLHVSKNHPPTRLQVTFTVCT
jgi:hypothetical protein